MSTSKKSFLGALIIISATIIFLFISLQSFKESDNKGDYISDFHKNYNIYALETPDSLFFAGERVPVENKDVWESLDRELLVNTYWQSQTMLFLKRSARDFQVIEPILKKYGVPDDFKYLAVAESGLLNVVSPAHAVGYWQLLEGTAQDYGLEVNDLVDERYHLEKATEAACKFLLESYEKYGNWTMAAASYNVGRRGLDRQIKRQKCSEYYDLLLNIETGRYVYRIIAIKEILSNPDKYGFNLNKDDVYKKINYRRVKIDSSVTDFANFAAYFNTNYKILKNLNPWLRDTYLTNPKNKEYIIKVPRARGRKR